MTVRPTWDATWMAVADAVAQRGRCVRRQAGCVLVDAYHRVVSTGYNGPPAGYPITQPNEMCDHFCLRSQTGGSLSYDDCVSAHSEANALIFADRSRLGGGTAYVTSCPCFTCSKNLANSGISRLVCRITDADQDRDPQRSLRFLELCGVEVEVVP